MIHFDTPQIPNLVPGRGQRIFFLHNGSTSDIIAAIELHAGNCSAGQVCSEATQVINTFNGLQPQQQQDIVNFLRSL